MTPSAIVVDDDPINNLICETLLKRSGKVETVRSFITASQALECLIALPRADYPSILLLDINMPLMDGWDFLAALNQKLPEHELSMAILTSSVSDVDRAKAATYASLAGYLTKPLTLEKINSIWP